MGKLVDEKPEPGLEMVHPLLIETIKWSLGVRLMVDVALLARDKQDVEDLLEEEGRGGEWSTW